MSEPTAADSGTTTSSSAASQDNNFPTVAATVPSASSVPASTSTAPTPATASASATPAQSAVPTTAAAAAAVMGTEPPSTAAAAADSLPSSASANGGGLSAEAGPDESGGGVEPAAKRRKRKSLWDQPAPANSHNPATASSVPSLTASHFPLPAVQPPPNPLLAQLQAQLALLPHLSAAAASTTAATGHHLAASHALSSPATASRLDRRIYVGSLAYDVTEDTLRIIFEPFGPVVKVDMPKEPGHVPVRSKGFAFVEFERPESARAALQTMDGMPLKGRPMKVNTPTGGPNAQTSLLSQLLLQQGGQGLAALQGSQLNSAALAAIQAAQLASGGTLLGLPASFTAAGPTAATSAPPAFTLPAHLTAAAGAVPSVYERVPGTISGSTAKTRIYVGSLMWQLTEEQVRQIFEPFGSIRSCQLIINPETGKHRGYGFIEFADEKSAADAIKEMDNFELVGRKLKVRYASALVAPQAAHQAHQQNQQNMQQQQLHQQLTAAAQLPPGFTIPTLPASLHGPPSSQQQQQQSLSTEDNLRISSAEQRASIMQKLSASSRSSPVLLLRNLLSPNEVDAELEGEVRDECGRFGRVREVKLHVADDEVRCYVLFDSSADCSRAVEALHGRWFGKRTVAADFYPLSSYEQGLFTAG